MLLLAALKSDTRTLLAKSDFRARDLGFESSFLTNTRLGSSSVTVKTIFISGLLLAVVGVTNLLETGFETTIAEVALGTLVPDIVMSQITFIKQHLNSVEVTEETVQALVIHSILLN